MICHNSVGYDAQIKEITDAIYEYWRESKNV